MCWSLERWGEIEDLKRAACERERATQEAVDRLMMPAGCRDSGDEPGRRGSPAVAGKRTPGEGAAGA